MCITVNVSFTCQQMIYFRCGNFCHRDLYEHFLVIFVVTVIVLVCLWLCVQLIRMLRKPVLRRLVIHSMLRCLHLKRLEILNIHYHLHTQHHMVQLVKYLLAMNSIVQMLLLWLILLVGS